MSDDLDVTVVSVTFNSAHVVGQMLASLPTGVPAVVVDNASVDDSLVVARSAGAKVLALNENLGFGTACNRGAEIAETRWLLFLNPDAVATDGALAKLISEAERHPQAAAFNPRIVDEAGSLVFRRTNSLIKRAGLPRTPPTGTAPVAALTGAAFLVRRDRFNEVGGFDENIFLFHEDDDLALRLETRYGPLMRVDSSTFGHVGGGSTAESATGGYFKSYEYARSRRYVLSKHKSRNWWFRTHWSIVRCLLDWRNLVDPISRASNWGHVRGAWNFGPATQDNKSR